MNEHADNAEGPITITVSRTVKPGREADYESWIKEVIKVAATFPGYLGGNVLKPAREPGGEYVSESSMILGNVLNCWRSCKIKIL